MNVVYKDERSRIIHGDCVEVMQKMKEASVDAIITDPPYELGFMNKAWDQAGVAFQVETWRAALRVLKPGAHLLAFGGTRTYHRMTCAIEDAGFEIRDSLHWFYGTGFPKSLNVGEGRGTALKPAHEPIVLARKPLIGTVEKNVKQFGTGALNIDACRIAMQDGETLNTPQSDPTKRAGEVGTDLGITGASLEKFQAAQAASIQRTKDLGRWPANVLLDEDAANELDTQSGTLKSGDLRPYRREETSRQANAFGKFPTETKFDRDGDSGGASRFFYVAKPSKYERNAGLPEGTKNNHPTVKPVSLLLYLIRLIAPKDGWVLDPFYGSGSTGVAARTAGFKIIGIEQSGEYVQIATERTKRYAELVLAKG